MRTYRWFVKTTSDHPAGSIYFAPEISQVWVDGIAFDGIAPSDAQVWLLWVKQYDAHLLIQHPLNEISREAYDDLLHATSATVTDHPERPRVNFTDEAVAYLKIGYS